MCLRSFLVSDTHERRKAFVNVLTAVLLISFGLSTGGNALGIGVLPIAILLVAGMLDALDQNDLS